MIGDRSSDAPPTRTGGTTARIGRSIGSTMRFRNSYNRRTGWSNDTRPNTTMYDRTIQTIRPSVMNWTSLMTTATLLVAAEEAEACETFLLGDTERHACRCDEDDPLGGLGHPALKCIRET